jgi:hypothetical protein
VSDDNLPPDDADVEQVNSKLNEGLQTCRSVVANYRTLLSPGDLGTAGNDNDNDRDAGDGAPDVDDV